ncbi:eukaryotic translation initiation factor 3 subunit A, partial [Dispira simplex]
MAPGYIKPENVVKKADELLNVGQRDAALNVLADVINSRRSRNVPVTVLEPTMLKLIQLCVEDRKGQMIKDTLQSYRNNSQNSNVGTIEKVVGELIRSVEARLHAAQEKLEQINLEQVEDLDQMDVVNPEAILMGAVSDTQEKDRRDRELVMPWLRFLWETYRNTLDTLRNNTRLEIIYQVVASQALDFCLKFQRKNEFHRLCDKLRNHLNATTRNINQAHGVSLQDPESMQRHLDLRFKQLHVATELELWQEAFRSIEDIYLLLSTENVTPKPSMLIIYYERLTRIMTVSGGDPLYHAAAWHKYYDTVRQHAKDMDTKDLERIAANVVLSTLAVPIANPDMRVTTMSVSENKSRDTRFCNLLGLAHRPKRAILINDMVTNGVLSQVSTDLRDFFYQMEEKFHPLSICRRVSPFLVSLQEHPEQGIYVKPLQNCMLTHLLQQLSQVYTVIKLDYIIGLAAFPAPLTFSATQMEKFIMNGCRRNEFPLRVDYQTRSVHFTTDVFSEVVSTANKGPQLQPTASDLVRNQLVSLATGLQAVTRVIAPELTDEHIANRMRAVATALNSIKQEHQWAMKRRAVIERRKEIIETLNARKEKEEARTKALLLQREQEAERERLAEEARRREVERIEKEREAIQKEEARRLAESLKSKGGLEVDEEELANMNKDKLMELQVEQLEKSKKVLESRLKNTIQRMDHLERAYRKVEIPLVEKDYERQKEKDRAYYEVSRKHQLVTSKHAHSEGLMLKAQMHRMLPAYQAHKKKIEARRSEELARLREKLAQKIELEKKHRVEEYHRLKEQERARLAAEEEERRRKEEEERLRIEEEERLEAERKELEEAERQAEAERRRKLDELAAKQEARQREVEAKQEARRQQ